MDTLGPRILIIGCSGSGKSTLARKLGARTGIPVVHLDKLFWKPGWVTSERAEFEARLRMELSKEAWIMDGNYDQTLPQRLTRATDVIAFDFPRWFCLYRALKRIVTTYGVVRPDMREDCPEKLDLSFLHWIWRFREDVWKPTVQLPDQHRDRVRIHTLRRTQEADEMVNNEMNSKSSVEIDSPSMKTSNE